MSKPSVPELLTTWKDNFTRNFSAAFTNLDAKGWIRIVMIVGTYALLRPYLMKLGAKMQEKQHAKESAESGEIHPNELRGQGKVEIPGVGDSDEEDEEEEKVGQWGRKARVRQRKFIRDALAKEEERLRDEQEAESDKELEEFLTG
ncbi:DUF1531-domain-containing protein [Trematosphaeria pertusa]|uniref:DUF1531-domain-containing protein n=1 Tax=Trematosphaeria pertusa TaxID=390896 RepID=A0A6A6J2P9_9PLEO|nr:DUF1531-domain-containing protein [Trematosphaeria pertusa]KAF2256999.1 DUF1531-domain-containing protein [Trematosphaeria pertusa]